MEDAKDFRAITRNTPIALSAGLLVTAVALLGGAIRFSGQFSSLETTVESLRSSQERMSDDIASIKTHLMLVPILQERIRYLEDQMKLKPPPRLIRQVDDLQGRVEALEKK